MAGARRGVRERGKSDPIDALAIARAALREGVETLPTARLAGPEREIRLLALLSRAAAGHAHPADQRAALAAARPLARVGAPRQGADPPRLADQDRLRLARAEQTSPGPDRARHDPPRPRADPRHQRPLRQARRPGQTGRAAAAGRDAGSGVLLAAKFIGEIAGIDRFTTDAQLARLAGCAPIPVSSGRTDRHRLDPGGNRRLNSAFYMLAIIQHPPRPPHRRLPRQTTRQRQDQHAKRSAASNATSSAASTTSSTTPARPNHHLLDIGAFGAARRIGSRPRPLPRRRSKGGRTAGIRPRHAAQRTGVRSARTRLAVGR